VQGDRASGASAPQRQPFATRPVLLLAAAKLAIHVLTNLISPYGIHRDAFLYFAMGRHLKLFRMDFPPAIAILAQVERLFGTSLVAARIVPALAGTAILVLAALIARELGGGRRTQVFTALTAITVPLFMRPSNLFQPVVLDQLWWTLGFYALARIGRDDAPRWWIVLGVAGGLGLLTKFSILFFGLAVLVGLAVSPLRRSLRTPWPWVALAIALVLGSPSVIGQVRLNFPVVEQMADLRRVQLGRVTPWDFLGNQLLLGPATVVALVGLGFLLRARDMWAFRQIGWTSAVVLLLLLALHGKAYYIGPIYPALYAAAWVALSRISTAGARRAIERLALGLAVAWGLIVLPMGLPLLPPKAMARYAAALGVTSAVETNVGVVLRLPQDYADMLGWQDRVQAVAQAFHRLTPAEQRTAAVCGGNYGEAGALDYYREQYDLPPAVSPAGSFWFFGPGDRPGDPLVTIGVDSTDLRQYFDSVTAVAHLTNAWTVPEEQDLTVYVARHAHGTLQEIWPSLAGRN
jgi:hypothetical protein